MASILSQRADGFGYFYGFAWPDSRQINVRYNPERKDPLDCLWEAHVGGKLIGYGIDKDAAEDIALGWIKDKPASVAE